MTINMFATENDTDKWAVCVDGQFGLFDDKAEADRVYDMIGGYDGDDGAAETPFGSSVFIPPRFVPRFLEGFTTVITKISEHKPCDIEFHIKRAYEKFNAPVDPVADDGRTFGDLFKIEKPVWVDDPLATMDTMRPMIEERIKSVTIDRFFDR